MQLLPPASAVSRQALSPNARPLCYLPDPNWTRINCVPAFHPPIPVTTQPSRGQGSRALCLWRSLATPSFRTSMKVHPSQYARCGVVQHAAPGRLQLEPMQEIVTASHHPGRFPTPDQLHDQETGALTRLEGLLPAAIIMGGGRAADIIGGASSWTPGNVAEEGGLPVVPLPADWHQHAALLSGCAWQRPCDAQFLACHAS